MIDPISDASVKPARPGVSEPPYEPLVGRRDPGAREQHVGQEQAQGDRGDRDRQKGEEETEEERPLGSVMTERIGQTRGQAVLVTVEHGEDRAPHRTRRDLDSRPDAGGRQTWERIRHQFDGFPEPAEGKLEKRLASCC